ncbi:MAG TPA: hypothetical protein VLX29_01830, partial [Nitrospirota bacterium]|nr:hypothetical protein [Nitrospirota bacterium]
MSMTADINWGDVATWVGSVSTCGAGVITLGLLMIGFIQIRNEREARKKREAELEIRKERDQAEHISCWMVKHGQYYSKVQDQYYQIE